MLASCKREPTPVRWVKCCLSCYGRREQVALPSSGAGLHSINTGSRLALTNLASSQLLRTGECTHRAIQIDVSAASGRKTGYPLIVLVTLFMASNCTRWRLYVQVRRHRTSTECRRITQKTFVRSRHACIRVDSQRMLQASVPEARNRCTGRS